MTWRAPPRHVMINEHPMYTLLIFLLIQAGGLAFALRLSRFAHTPPDHPLGDAFVAFLPQAPRLPLEARTNAPGWL